MVFNINIISLIGYIILAIAFGLKVKNNLLSDNKVLIVGSSVVVIGYFVSGISYGVSAVNKLSKYNYGHVILAIYYLVSFLFPLENNRNDTDVLALVGHILLIKNNYNQFNLFGMTSLYAYFVISIINLFKNFDNLENKVMLAGNGMIIIFFSIRLYQILFKSSAV